MDIDDTVVFVRDRVGGEKEQGMGTNGVGWRLDLWWWTQHTMYR